MIDNLMVGHQFIKKEFGVEAVPRIGWHLDSFGHSQTNQRLLAELGMDATFVGRSNHFERLHRGQNKELEFIWKTSEETEILFLMNPNGNYENPSFIEFDGFNNQRAEPVITDRESSLFNADRIAQQLKNSVQNTKFWYKDHGQLMILVGADFRWENALFNYFNFDELI